MFGKKIKESDKVDIVNLGEPAFDWTSLKTEEAPLFKSLRSLIYEAESQFKAQELQLCDDILSVVIRHIKRNKLASVENISVVVEDGNFVKE